MLRPFPRCRLPPTRCFSARPDKTAPVIAPLPITPGDRARKELLIEMFCSEDPGGESRLAPALAALPPELLDLTVRGRLPLSCP